MGVLFFFPSSGGAPKWWLQDCSIPSSGGKASTTAVAGFGELWFLCQHHKSSQLLERFAHKSLKIWIFMRRMWFISGSVSARAASSSERRRRESGFHGEKKKCQLRITTRSNDFTQPSKGQESQRTASPFWGKCGSEECFYGQRNSCPAVRVCSVVGVVDGSGYFLQDLFRISGYCLLGIDLNLRQMNSVLTKWGIE